MKEWTLTPRGTNRFQTGHPWVFSNELQHSPKGLTPGALVLLKDHKNQSLAIGYGNPHSLIAFRKLTNNAGGEFLAEDFFQERLLSAAKLRHKLGYHKCSFRLCYSEADSLPGIVIDYYLLKEGGQVFAAQILTAGMEALFLPTAATVLERFTTAAHQAGLIAWDWSQTGVVLNRSSQSRQLEGLNRFDPEIARSLEGIDLAACTIQVRSATPGQPSLGFLVDLIHGQKTGFFLDQFANIALACNQLFPAGKNLKVLDLFSYAGHWGAQIAANLKSKGCKVTVCAVDYSAKALTQARTNLEPVADAVEVIELDLIKAPQQLPAEAFDIVVCDPPALIKAKKDYPQGKQAYIKVNSAAMAAAKRGGYFISSSCSQHLNETDLFDVLNKAECRSERHLMITGKGQQSPDHPVLAGFAQGQYLKAIMGFLQ